MSLEAQEVEHFDYDVDEETEFPVTENENDLLGEDENDLLGEDENDLLGENENDLLGEDENDVVGEDENDLLGENDNGISEFGDEENGTKDIVNQSEDPELVALKTRAEEMERESEKLRLIHKEMAKLIEFDHPSVSQQTWNAKVEADSRSIFVGNVDYGATMAIIREHFDGCGTINRISIPRDKHYGNPKGFAYIEFADKDSVRTSEDLDGSLLRGRQIKVIPKRTNAPGISSTNRFPRTAYSSASRPPRGRGFGAPPFQYRGRGRGGTSSFQHRGRGYSWHTIALRPPRSQNHAGYAPVRGSSRWSRFNPY